MTDEWNGEEAARAAAYAANLRARIIDSARWPQFDRPKFLEELDVIAREALDKGTVEGYLASVLIYHQLVEEMAKLLLEDAHFYIQLAVFPAAMHFPEKKKQTFGHVLLELKATLSFDQKDAFISMCDELNKHRIDLVHRLTQRGSLATVRQQADQVRHLYEETFCLFDGIHDNFRICFKDFRKDGEWDDAMQ